MEFGKIVAIIIILVLVGGLGYFVTHKESVGLEVFSPPTGAVDAGKIYVSSETSYTCNVNGGSGDYCDVIGYIKSVPEVSSGKVSFRTESLNYMSGNLIALDRNSDGALECYKYSTFYKTYTNGKPEIITQTPEGYDIHKYQLDKVIIYAFDNPIYTPSTECTSDFLKATSIPSYYSAGKETVSGKKWGVIWNFCPPGNSNFKYCAVSTGTDIRNYDFSPSFTSSALGERINEGSTITFSPTTINGQALPDINYYLIVQKWDLLCNKVYTNKCSVNNKLCSPTYSSTQYSCPSGWTLRDSPCCQWYQHGGVSYSESKCYYNNKSICSKDSAGTTSNGYYSQCADATPQIIKSNFTTYYSCSGKNSDSCPIWGTTLSICPKGTQCYVNGQLTSGVGDCGCSPTSCDAGSRRASQLGGDYDLCVIPSGSVCTDWQSMTCAAGLVYDSTKQKCLNLPNDVECSSNIEYSKCIGNDLYKCVPNSIIDEAGTMRFQLKLSESCVYPKNCITESSSLAYCGCTCAGIECSSVLDKYYACLPDTCKTEKNLTAGTVCYNNQIYNEDDINCQNGGIKCDAGKTCNRVTKTCVMGGCYYDPVNYKCGDTITGQVCNDNQSSTKFNSCYCGLIDDIYCGENIGIIKCSSLNSYKICSDSGSSIICPKWSNSLATESDKICINNKIVVKSTIACEQGGSKCSIGYECINNNCVRVGCEATPSDARYKCSDVKDKNGGYVETCSNNNCVCDSGIYAATINDFNANEDRCYQNKIQKVIKYDTTRTVSGITTSNICYRWEDYLDCTGLQQVCSKNSPAVCRPVYDDVGILVEKDIIGVSNSIGKVTIDVIGGLNTVEFQDVKIWLEDVAAPNVTITDTIQNSKTDSSGKAFFDIGYKPTKTGQIKIVTLVGSTYNTLINPIRKEKIITVKEALRFNSFACTPVRPIVTRETKCSWAIVNARTNAIISDVIPTITLMQGNTMPYSSYASAGESGIKFTVSTLDPVYLKLEANKEGYIGALDELTLYPQDLEVTTEEKIDNTDMFTVLENGITSGTHTIKIKFLESGVPADIAYIDAKMELPAGTEVPVTFSKSYDNSGTWTANYDFKQSGQKYVLSIQAYSDPTSGKQDPLPITRNILTIQSSTPPTVNYVIIGVAAGFILIIVIIVIILFRKR